MVVDDRTRRFWRRLGLRAAYAALVSLTMGVGMGVLAHDVGFGVYHAVLYLILGFVFATIVSRQAARAAAAERPAPVDDHPERTLVE